jgi:fumarate hydratase subunit beta
MIRIRTPLDKEAMRRLKAGDEVLFSGAMLTARDAAHKRLSDLIKRGKRLPVQLKGAVIYYSGPTPAKPGMVIGSCGPTTSSRMDPFTPAMLRRGVGAIVGKGARSPDTVRAIKKYGCVYLIAPGGLGAHLAMKVKSARVAHFGDLGTEAIHELEVKDFPLIVGVDAKGRSVYEEAGRKGRRRAP